VGLGLSGEQGRGVKDGTSPPLLHPRFSKFIGCLLFQLSTPSGFSVKPGFHQRSKYKHKGHYKRFKMLMICVFCSYNNYKLPTTTESASVASASACVASENQKITIMINSEK